MAASRKTEETADRIHGAAIRLLRFVRKEDAASAISAAQLSVLSVLVFAGPQSLASLAAAEQVKPPTMSQLVTEMERKGLVIRTPVDRRSIRISATAKGRRLMEAGRKRRLARLSAGLAHLPDAKLALLREAADLMLAATEDSR
ncbi:MAG TPA: MarR family transcriptional regulator [Rhizomicrobium sp.]|nr:MarR family transcriptional regulator [Rhizomicrobium sp.]